MVFEVLCPCPWDQHQQDFESGSFPKMYGNLPRGGDFKSKPQNTVTLITWTPKMVPLFPETPNIKTSTWIGEEELLASASVCGFV